ncbi:hypothetical protein AXG93_4891s1020 [Marchantia polymorpha subsp. ruderalis]|uniref:Uncharacterized protein n=1 Tax=Marchantia polymorpha subsp. ruderalis TaxID=1480154 RepID=A0A176W8D8_MARPO|nr:hypothetical protein AXG93_4891s1020 [Marchantia polymorpha subsp. ruderalis]
MAPTKKSEKVRKLVPLKVPYEDLRPFRRELSELRLEFLLWNWNCISASICKEIMDKNQTEGEDLRGNPLLWIVEHWTQVLGQCVGREEDLMFEKSSVALTRVEEFSYGPLIGSGRQGTNGWKTMNYLDPKRRAIALGVMHILRPARTTYVTAWQVGFFERILSGQKVHWAKIFHELVWVNASARWAGPLANPLTPFLVHFYRGMGLLTKEELRRFPRERELLTAESSKRTEDDTRQPSIPPQTTARGPVQVDVVQRQERPEKRLAKRRKVVSDDESDLALETRSARGEETPRLKRNEELVKEPTLSEEILERVVSQIGGSVIEPVSATLPPTSIADVRPEDGEKTSGKEVKSLEVTFPEFLQDNVVPLLQYLDKKRETYAISKEVGFYVELIRNRTKLKRSFAVKREGKSATELARERATILEAECAAVKVTLKERESQLREKEVECEVLQLNLEKEAGRCAELEETCVGLRASNENVQKVTVDLVTRLEKSKEAYEAVKRSERLIVTAKKREKMHVEELAKVEARRAEEVRIAEELWSKIAEAKTAEEDLRRKILEIVGKCDLEFRRAEELLASLAAGVQQHAKESESWAKKLADCESTRSSEVKCRLRVESKCRQLREQLAKADLRSQESHRKMEKAEEAYRRLRDETTDVLKLRLEKCLTGFAMWGLQTVKWLKLDSLERRLMEAKASGSVGHKQIVELVNSFSEELNEAGQNVEVEIINVLRRLGVDSSSDDAVTVTSDCTVLETDSFQAVDIPEMPL